MGNNSAFAYIADTTESEMLKKAHPPFRRVHSFGVIIIHVEKGNNNRKLAKMYILKC